MGLDLQVNKSSGGGSSTYWSKPSMRRATNASLIVDGSITAASIAANSIYGAAIQAGAITADKLSVTSLDAISANLGNVNISSANIGSLVVGQSNIANNAATYPANGAGGGPYSMSANAEQTIVNCVVVNSNNGTVHLTGALYAMGAACTVKIYRNGTVIRQYGTPAGSTAWAIADSPGNGSVTYSLNVQATSGPLTIASGGNINAVAYMK
jgi:hypothetical protein